MWVRVLVLLMVQELLGCGLMLILGCLVGVELGLLGDVSLALIVSSGILRNEESRCLLQLQQLQLLPLLPLLPLLHWCLCVH